MRVCSSIYHFAMGLAPETRNVIQLGIAFLFIFGAFNTNGFIMESVIASVAEKGSLDKHAGYYSMAIIYFVFTFGNFVAAPIVDVISPKWAMVAGGFCYAAFLAGFLFLNSAYLYGMSALLGFAAAVIWTGQGTYLAKNCDERTSGRNSAILWGILQTSLLSGGTFLLLVFHSQDNTEHIPHETVMVLYGVFTSLALVGVVVLALLRSPPAYLQTTVSETKIGHYELIISTFRCLIDRRFLILAITFAYTGILQSFWTGIYPTCISFTRKLGTNTNAYLAWGQIASGCGQCLAGGLFGLLGSRTARFGRDSIVFLGTSVHLLVFVFVYINFPSDANLGKTDNVGVIEPSLALALVTAFLLAFGDGCWNTQIYSHLVANFPLQPSQAFALYKFYQSAMSCAAFFYSSQLPLPYHLLIMLVTSLGGALAFFAAERAAKRRAVTESRPQSQSTIKETPSSIVTSRTTPAAYDSPMPIHDE